MTDQASALRQMVQNIKKSRSRQPGDGARVVCITSGKGGVGKTNITVNLALSLQKKGLRVLVVDADFGLANVDVMMGVTPPFDLSHVISREKELQEVIFEGPGGVKIVSGGSGVYELLNLTSSQLSESVEKLLTLEDIADVIIFDTGAGVSSNILKLIEASNEVIVVTTPEPTAIMDAYALIKTVRASGSESNLRLIVNKAENVTEAHNTMNKFIGVVRLYLQTEIEELGFVLTDTVVSKSVRMQRPFVLSFPKSMAAKNIDDITWKFMNLEPEQSSKIGLKGFLSNLLRQ